MKPHPYFPDHILKDGQLWAGGAHKFLKTGKPLRNFADVGEVNQLIQDLSIIRGKGYDNLSLNCYWHHFNPSGDGDIEVSLDPLRSLIEAIRSAGMYVSLSVETYGVGGGQIPEGFWKIHPEAASLNHMGATVRDTEYGYNSAVPSIFHKGYTTAARQFMTSLVKQLDAANFLYFETTVEPQYMGAEWIDYSEFSRTAYRQWCILNQTQGAVPIPEGFPIEEDIRRDTTWNRFRAQTLAEWVNGDARALKAGADNADLWIASDYLDAEERTAIRRCGDPTEFLRNLTETDILQVNWSWCNIRREPNARAYKRIHNVMLEQSRDWAISEHMTINGADYSVSDMQGLLRNTLLNGTRFGWEFVDIAADTDDPSLPPNTVNPGDFKPAHFAVYDKNWDPKPPMAAVEDNWQQWQVLINAPIPKLNWSKVT